MVRPAWPALPLLRAKRKLLPVSLHGQQRLPSAPAYRFFRGVARLPSFLIRKLPYGPYLQRVTRLSPEVAHVFVNRSPYYWSDCGRVSKADHAGERPRRNLDNYGPWSCWLLGRYMLGARARLVCNRSVRWLCDVDLGR